MIFIALIHYQGVSTVVLCYIVSIGLLVFYVPLFAATKLSLCGIIKIIKSLLHLG